MKKIIFLILNLFFVFHLVKAQGTWTKKTSFGGTARCYAVGFSIGTKGYIGTGMSTSSIEKDFWEWDEATNVWTQKADFGGGGRIYAVGFSIGNKGYIGTGSDNITAKNDFWEWDQASNTWTQKANFGGAGRENAVGFSIGNKGYIGTAGPFTNDFWEWNQVSDTWIQKANFGGIERSCAVGFSIGIKGYIGTGVDPLSAKNDFWEWDQATNIWTQKANFGGTARALATGFSIGNKGYIGTGTDGSSLKQDFWQWDQASNTWTQQANFGGMGREYAVGFSIGNKGYIGTGWDGSISCNDFWEWYSLTLSTSSTNINCNGNNDGTASVSVTGGITPYTYNWSNGGTTNSISSLSSGTYTLTVIDGSGYILSAPIIITQPQMLSINHTATNSSCYNNGGAANVIVNGGAIPYSYLWSNGTTTQNIAGVGAGAYSVVVTDNNGCTISDAVVINNSMPLNSIPICMVTVDNTNKNVIVWEKPATVQPIDSFRIYREIASVFKHIGSMSYAALSTFTDMTTGVNPNIAAYKYEISVVDTCGNESSLSSFHKTIHVSMGPASPCGYNLIWNDYTGFPTTQYLIYRDSAKTGWKIVDSLSFGNTSWTDGTCYVSTDTVAYLIEAVNPVGCNPSIKNPQPMTSIGSTRSNTQQNFSNTSVTEILNVLSFEVSPNPSSGKFTIKNDELHMNNYEVKIYNVFGEKVYTRSNSNEIDLSSQPKGIYFIEMISGEQRQSKKIVLQ
jgi:hypothetical protein